MLRRGIAVSSAAFVLSFTGGPAAGSTAAATTVPPDDTAPTTIVNEYFPENRDLSECISALPEPDCGSDARGGSRQMLVFGAVLLAMFAIGGRIAYGVHKGRADLDKPSAADGQTDGDDR